MEIIVTAVAALLGTVIGGLISYFTSERSSKRNVELEMNKMKISYLMTKFDVLKNIVENYDLSYTGNIEIDYGSICDDYKTISQSYINNICYLNNANETYFRKIIVDLDENGIQYSQSAIISMCSNFNKQVDQLFRDELTKTSQKIESLIYIE